MSTRDELGQVLIDHLQLGPGRGCVCGWDEIGLSHPHHQANMILTRWRLMAVHDHTWVFYENDSIYHEIDACQCGLWREHLHRCRVNEYGQHQCELASWHAHTDNHGPRED